MTTFSFDEVLAASQNYFNGDDLAAKVFITKYALTDKQGNIYEKTPTDMHHRLAKEFARIEARYPNPLSEEQIFAHLDQFKYIVPQGSPMAGIGNPYQITSISNCFVIDSPADSYGGIFKFDQEEAQIMKRRGGVGGDISTIRPRGLYTNNAAKTTDGIAVFMERFSNTCREVAQGGRRGALMLSISVHHPEIETFINIKRDLKKVTGANISIRLSDEFMNAVKNKTDVELRWPVDSKNPSMKMNVDANHIWNQINESAHASAEPGILFWDTIKKWSPADAYPEFQTVSTNPCFSGETLIAVADGRNAVSIRQLTEEGKDIPVYSTDPTTGIISIKTGRNPRITGIDKKLVRVSLDNGSHFDVTPDHKCMLRDGTPVVARDLKHGDSLSPFAKEVASVKTDGKEYYRIRTDTRNSQNGKVFEHRLIAKHNDPKKWEETYVLEQKNKWAKGGLVVHHKDYNGLNNCIDNLNIMTFKEHQKYHAEHDNQGENNGRALDISAAQIKEHAINLTKILNRRFSNNEWQAYAKNNKLPQTFSSWRQSDFFKSPVELAKACAVECGIENCECDPRLTRTLTAMLAQGYSAELVGNQVLVEKTCETCSNLFSVEHNKREISFCSHSCSLIYVNSSKEVNVCRTASLNKLANEKSLINKEEQARIFSALKFSLNRDPLSKEWEIACKTENIPFRIGKSMKYGFKTWGDVKEAGNAYNHKVLSVEELPGEHTVYNITVDDNHTVSLITNINENGLTGVNAFQCGEITLSPYDSCRLLLVNTVSFVANPFTPQAKFDYKKYGEVVNMSQRLMDDMIELELENIDKILAKIDADPEAQDVKLSEIELWNKIKTACIRGRRTGLGVTSIGDTVAAMNTVYGSEGSVELIEEVYKHLAINSYRSSITLAKERGAFPAYDYELEKDHPFINRIMNEDAEMKADWAKYGRRNIANTTTAPAGSVSVLTQTTSGIEPAFMLAYKRRKKITAADNSVKVDYVDNMGDKWQEFNVYHHWFKTWMDITGKTDPKESPYWGGCSNDIVWVNKTKAQAVAQKWICHSISNTTNVPADTSVDVIKSIYMTGWESGCKGITVYRDGSRAGVLVSQETKKTDDRKAFTEHSAPKRPKELICDIHTMSVHGEKWTFFVGMLEGRPYEIMGGLSKFVNIPKRVKSGKILIHNGPSNPIARYDLHYDFEKGPEDEAVIKDITSLFENAVHSAFTRVTSLSLRHGTPVQFVVEQIQKGSEVEDDLFSFSKALSRVLKPYIKDGTKVSADKKCPTCGAPDLVYQEGCMLCRNCAFSKCN